MPFLTYLWLPPDARVLAVEERPDYVYFPESVIISVIACGDNERNCYVGLYGFEGFGSVAAALDVPTSQADEVVQHGGFAYQIRTSDLHSLLQKLPELRRKLQFYVHVFLMQVSYTAFANSNIRVEQRLARLLLMYQDRTRTSSLTITHQRLAEILSVRRSGITESIHLLEGEKLIHAQRGLIDILDRPRLAALTAGSYGAPEAEHLRLIC